MKKILLSTCFLLYTSLLFSQFWFQEDASWKYRYGFWAVTGYETLSVDGDTLVDGKDCKIIRRQAALKEQISGEYYSETYPPIPAYEENDVIYYHYNDSFHIAYDFNLQVGDSLYYIGSTFDETVCDSTFYFVLDSVNTQFILNQNRRVQYGYMVNNFTMLPYPLVVIEGIGGVQDNHYLFPDFSSHCLTDGESWYLCNFYEGEDSLRTDSCMFLTSTQNISTPTITLEAFPNPSTGTLNIQYDHKKELKQLSIYNSKGQLLRQIPKPSDIIILEEEIQGLLILQFQFEEGIIHKKIIRH